MHLSHITCHISHRLGNYVGLSGGELYGGGRVCSQTIRLLTRADGSWFDLVLSSQLVKNADGVLIQNSKREPPSQGLGQIRAGLP